MTLYKTLDFTVVKYIVAAQGSKVNNNLLVMQYVTQLWLSGALAYMYIPAVCSELFSYLPQIV